MPKRGERFPRTSRTKQSANARRRLLPLAINILLSIGVFIALFLIAECAMRALGAAEGIDHRLYLKELKNSDRLPSGLFLPSNGPLHLRPNAQVLATTSDFSVVYTINSKGLRDKEYGYEKPDGVTRFVAFGDSFTFGEGVSYGERFTDIAENGNSQIEVLNFGVPGYGLDQELLYFAGEGVKYSADYAVIFISVLDVGRYTTNIVHNGSVSIENAAYHLPSSDGQTQYFKRDSPFFQQKPHWLLENSYFLSYLSYRIRVLLLSSTLDKYDRDLWAQLSVSGNPALPKDGTFSETEFTAYRTRLILKKFNELAQQNGMKLIIIKIDPIGDLRPLIPVDKNILYYDLTEGLLEEQKKYPLTFIYDSHYNPKTHRYIGREFERIISELPLS